MIGQTGNMMNPKGATGYRWIFSPEWNLVRLLSWYITGRREPLNNRPDVGKTSFTGITGQAAVQNE